MQPCSQGDRLVTLEVILQNMAETLNEQKQVSVKTYEVLADISEQGAEIKSLTKRTDTLETDVEAAFKSIRRIDLRHAEENGEDAESRKWRTRAIWLVEKCSIPGLMTFLFIVWLGDKFNLFVYIVNAWKEFKG